MCFAQCKTKCIPTTSTHSDSLLNIIPPFKMMRHLEKMDLNETERQKLGTCRYPRLYSDLLQAEKKEYLIALGSHHEGGGGGGNFCIPGIRPLGDERVTKCQFCHSELLMPNQGAVFDIGFKWTYGLLM